jgi:hypothetical protein
MATLPFLEWSAHKKGEAMDRICMCRRPVDGRTGCGRVKNWAGIIVVGLYLSGPAAALAGQLDTGSEPESAFGGALNNHLDPFGRGAVTELANPGAPARLAPTGPELGSGKMPLESKHGAASHPSSVLTVPTARQGRAVSKAIPTEAPTAATIDDLSRDFATRAMTGIVRSPMESASGANPVAMGGQTEAVGGGGQDQGTSPLSDVREMMGELTKVTSVNGLGAPVGLANQAISMVSGLARDVAGQSASGPDQSRSDGPDKFAVGYQEEGNVGQNGGSTRGPPTWQVRIEDTWSDFTSFIQENRILMAAVGFLALGMTAMIRRNS